MILATEEPSRLFFFLLSEEVSVSETIFLAEVVLLEETEAAAAFPSDAISAVEIGLVAATSPFDPFEVESSAEAEVLEMGICLVAPASLGVAGAVRATGICLVAPASPEGADEARATGICLAVLASLEVAGAVRATGTCLVTPASPEGSGMLRTAGTCLAAPVLADGTDLTEGACCAPVSPDEAGAERLAAGTCRVEGAGRLVVFLPVGTFLVESVPPEGIFRFSFMGSSFQMPRRAENGGGHYRPTAATIIKMITNIINGGDTMLLKMP